MTDTAQHRDTNSMQRQPQDSSDLKRTLKWAAVGLIALVVGVFAAAIALATLTDAENTARLVALFRDSVIILLTLTGILIIIELAILILQVSRLINLTKNEFRPILRNAQEGVRHATGTSEFVGENVTGPAIRVLGFLAGLRVMLRDLMGIRRAIRREDGRRSHGQK